MNEDKPKCICCGKTQRVIKKQEERAFLKGKYCKSCYFQKGKDCFNCIQRFLKFKGFDVSF